MIRANVVAAFLPLLIATRNTFAEDAAKYQAVVDLCERYAFRVYRLLERRADAGQGELVRIGYELQSKSIDFDSALRRMRTALHSFCPDNRFEEAFGEG